MHELSNGYVPIGKWRKRGKGNGQSVSSHIHDAVGRGLASQSAVASDSFKEVGRTDTGSSKEVVHAASIVSKDADCNASVQRIASLDSAHVGAGVVELHEAKPKDSACLDLPQSYTASVELHDLQVAASDCTKEAASSSSSHNRSSNDNSSSVTHAFAASHGGIPGPMCPSPEGGKPSGQSPPMSAALFSAEAASASGHGPPFPGNEETTDEVRGVVTAKELSFDRVQSSVDGAKSDELCTEDCLQPHKANSQPIKSKPSEKSTTQPIKANEGSSKKV